MLKGDFFPSKGKKIDHKNGCYRFEKIEDFGGL